MFFACGISTPVVCVLPKDEKRVQFSYPAQEEVGAALAQWQSDAFVKRGSSVQVREAALMNRLSRLSRFEEKKAYRRFALNILGMICLLFLVIFLGIPGLIKFSSVISGFKNQDSSQQQQKDTVTPFAPHLEASYTATNSANITVQGFAEAGTTLELFVNGETFKKMLLPGNGQFTVYNINLQEGENKITATAKDSSNNTSSPSDPLIITYKKTGPKLIVEKPNDGDKINGEKTETTVSGQVEENSTLTINGRLVMIKDDNTFIYLLPLTEGDNQIEIIATDIAGNQTKIDRKITYSP